MKISIDKNGYLSIERKGVGKLAYCPFDYDEYNNDLLCGDWCALFGEPEIEYQDIKLQLCHKTHKVHKNDFEDLRGK